ncbi:hypothetical protein LIER_41258 [Lithospermum erythrorhizon]|uniref:Reverse transcriptase n=1 Tax=Lithospermum erythrorhizon TaxID=34254 RepID=A0AAV3R6I8_LITER
MYLNEGVHSLEAELDKAWGEEADEELNCGIKDAEGVWQEGSYRVEEQVLRYFGDIFHANDVCIPESETQKVDHRVTEEMNYHLTRIVTNEEVRKAVFEMPADKSPGPNGMTRASRACYRQQRRDRH